MLKTGSKMTPDYAQQTLNTPNPIARFAHRKRYELSIGRVIKALGPGQSLLDFGCGKGDFLNQIAEARKDVKLFGFDPESGHSSAHYQITTDPGTIAPSSIDVFCCFETIEHLYPDEKNRLYADAKRVLKDSGTLIFSVPIIGGPTLLLKETNRMLLFRRKPEYSAKELLLASMFGVPANRPSNPRSTHKGFDFRETERELRSHFEVKEKYFSPFARLPWQLNSQVFFVCVKR
jgi:SAM-dependent methyltransferase